MLSPVALSSYEVVREPELLEDPLSSRAPESRPIHPKLFPCVLGRRYCAPVFPGRPEGPHRSRHWGNSGHTYGRGNRDDRYRRRFKDRLRNPIFFVCSCIRSELIQGDPTCMALEGLLLGSYLGIPEALSCHRGLQGALLIAPLIIQGIKDA